MKRLICWMLAACLLPFIPLAARAGEESALAVTVSPHRAAFTCALPGETYAYLTYDTALDKGEIILYAQDGVFSGELALPGCYDETPLGVNLYAASGERVQSVRMQTAAADDLPTPCESLDMSVPGTAKTRDLTLTVQEGGVRFAFTAPGRDRVYLKCSSAQETHYYTLASGENWRYEGFAAMPYTYPDGNITVSVVTRASSQTLASASVNAYCALPPAAQKAADGPLKGVTVCVDPGHQRQTQTETVPLAPNLDRTSTTKSGMARGVVTGRRESIVVLEVALRLRDELLALGADVIMTRETQDTFVGMKERADIANDAGAHIALRLHCNSRDNASVRGIQIYCPYQSTYAQAVASFDQYREMGFALLEAMQEATLCDTGDCTLTNAYVGNNWSKMPSFLVEMGYLSNHAEDLMLNSAPYQQALARGMAQGVIRIARMRGLIP